MDPATTLILASAEASAPQHLGVAMTVLFVAAALLSALCKRFGVEAIPGYLLAGALIGPHALGLIRGEEAVESVSSLAVVLLMFTIGLHLDFSSIRRGIVHILAVGAASTVAVMLVVFMLLWAVGVSPPTAVLLAMAASMSSTAILVRMLMAQRQLHSVVGRVTIGVSIVQDLASVVMLAAIPALVVWSGQEVLTRQLHVSSTVPEWAQKLLSAGLAVSGVFLLLVAGKVLLPRLLAQVARLQSQELVLVTSAAVGLLAAGWTTFIGFSAEMGAFLAGFMLAGTPFRFQLSGQLSPMRDLLMAIFFTSVGLRVDPTIVMGNLPVILLAVVGLLVIKSVLIGGSAYLAGMTASSAVVAGVLTANVGEFSLVLLGAGDQLLSDTQRGISISVVCLSLLANPFIVPPAQRLGERLRGVRLSPLVKGSQLREPEAPPAPKADTTAPAQTDDSAMVIADAEVGDATPLRRPRHVIIAGFGPVGRALADRFEVQGVPFTVVELNAATVQRQHTLGKRVVYGDITNRDVLESAQLERADAVVLTIPDDEATLRACQVIREAAPQVFIAARTNFLSGKFVALQLGADVVTVAEVATAQAMEREVLDGLGRWLEQRERSHRSGRAAPTP